MNYFKTRRKIHRKIICSVPLRTSPKACLLTKPTLKLKILDDRLKTHRGNQIEGRLKILYY